MQQVVILLLSSLLVVCEFQQENCPNVKTPLNLVRKRRHLVFPDGSDIVLTASIVKAIMTHAPAGWNIALELDVHYPLPNANFTMLHLRRKLHHRQKKDMWMKIENALNLHNLDGRACVLKSVCEARAYLAPPGKSLVHDILRAILTVPENDEEFAGEMHDVYNELLSPDYCEELRYCPFSLLQFLTPHGT
ncbi:hypothetical protein evm_007702 [Chilo suppressalis]|nr:hypothetical protein evm_007702 [Chilo suppressalis]